MAEATLVDRDIRAGNRLVKLLDEKKYPVFAALWLYRPEFEDWRLLIGSAKVDDQGSRQAYRELQRAITKGRATPGVHVSDVSLVGADDAFLRLLGRAIRTDPNAVSEIRFTKNMVDGVFVEDALIYRLALPGAGRTGRA